MKWLGCCCCWYFALFFSILFKIEMFRFIFSNIYIRLIKFYSKATGRNDLFIDIKTISIKDFLSRFLCRCNSLDLSRPEEFMCDCDLSAVCHTEVIRVHLDVFFSLFIFMNLDVNSWHRTRSHFHPSFWRLSLIYLLFLLCASEWRKWSEAVAVAVLGMILVCPKFDNNFGLLMCSGLLRVRERKRVCIICWIVRYLLYVHFRCPLFWWNWTEEAIHKTQNVCGHYTVWAWIYFQLFGHKHTRK